MDSYLRHVYLPRLPVFVHVLRRHSTFQKSNGFHAIRIAECAAGCVRGKTKKEKGKTQGQGGKGGKKGGKEEREEKERQKVGERGEGK